MHSVGAGPDEAARRNDGGGVNCNPGFEIPRGAAPRVMRLNWPACSTIRPSEFTGVGTGDRVNDLLGKNPHVRFADGRHRGYVRVEVTPTQWKCDLRAMRSVKDRNAACETLASFAVADGRPGPQKV